ncbi:MAG: hypothetical protein ACM3ZC_00935 [Bacteroidota bacterium]
MNTRNDVQHSLDMCQTNATKLKNLAQTESSQTCKELLMDAAHHLDVAVAECTYTLRNV